MAADMTTLNNLLKVVYASALTWEINGDNVFLDRLRRETPSMDISGDYFRLTNVKAYTQGVGSRRSRVPEGTVTQENYESPPPAGNTKTFTPLVRPTALFGRIQLDDFLLDSTRNQEGAVANALELEMESLKLAFANMINTAIHGGPSMCIKACRTATEPAVLDGVGGFLALFTGTGATITSAGRDVTFQEPLGTDWLQEGMSLELWNLETPTLGGTGAQAYLRLANSETLVVSAVKSHTVATLLPTATVTDGSGKTYGVARKDDIFSLAANLNACATPYSGATVRIIPKGLHSLPWAVSDDMVFEGIDPAANATWQAQYLGNSGGNRALTLDLMASMDTKCAKAGAQTSFLIGTHEIRQKFYLMLFSLVRFVNTLKMPGGFNPEGWTGLDYFGKPLLADAWAYPNHLYWVDERDWSWAQMNEQGWLQRDNQVLRYTEGTGAFPAWYAIWRWYVQLYLKSRRRQGCLADIEQ